MRKAGLLILVCLFVFGTAQISFGASNYVVGKLGVFMPGDDLGDSDEFDGDNGFNGEIAIGHKYTDNVAVEVGLGYYSTESGFSTEYYTGDIILGDWSLDLDATVTVVPLTVSVKGILPVDRFNLYAGGGIGAYFGRLEWDAKINSTTLGYYKTDDSEWSTVFGGQFMAGFEYNLNDQMFLGVEGKYMLTGDAEWDTDLGDVESNLNGGAVTATVGYRF